MFEAVIGRHADCEHPTRREVMQVGALGAFGLTLPGLLRAQAAAASQGRSNRDVNCILLWMQGGPSHHDTFDPKPDAPAEIRGEFKTIATTLPGVHYVEHLPLLARAAHKTALLRNFNPRNGSHGTADAEMMTGHKYTPTLTYPCYGSVIAKEKGYREGLPPFVQMGTSIDRRFGGGVAGFLGNALNPFEIPGDPSAAGFSVRDVQPPNGVPYARIERRLEMLAALDNWQRAGENVPDSVASMDTFYQKAHSMITAPRTKSAFDIAREPDKLRDGYGRNRFGQSCLLARRLIEAGVRFVTVTDGGWDTHQNNFRSLKDRKLPPLDQALSCLLTDLENRGMLESTLVVWMGDFGRTPKINSAAGRDHWATAGNVIFAGGGTAAGVCVGKTDKEGSAPEGKNYYTPDVAATIYKALGISLETVYHTPDGRPIHLCLGSPIPEVVG
jgi:hypothetical protein